MTPLYPAAAGGPESDAMDAFASAEQSRCALTEQGSVSLKAAPKTRRGRGARQSTDRTLRDDSQAPGASLGLAPTIPALPGNRRAGNCLFEPATRRDDFQRRVALKVFSPAPYADVASYETEMARIASVARRVARIQQDNLVDVHNFIKHRGIRLLEMEWVDGYDLQRLCRPHVFEQIRSNVSPERWEYINDFTVTHGKESLRFKPGIAVSVLRGCLAAVAALHRDGIVHSDLKPSNIMLKRTGSTKIIDVGSAFDLYDSPPSGRCTPAYAAPEVLEGQPGSQQSDLASLGYVLLEMLRGEQPFAGKTRFGELLCAKSRSSHGFPNCCRPKNSRTASC